jgi:hypothetical protein
MAVTLNASTSSGLVQTADTSGTIELQSNGTTKATVSSSGLAIGQYNPSTSLVTSGTAVASTSGTSIDFTSIPSWVKRITVMFKNVSLSGNAEKLIQLGTSSGVTTSGYQSGSVIVYGTNSVIITSNANGFVIRSDQPLEEINGHYVFTLIGSNGWVGSSIVENYSDRCWFGAGRVNLAATLDRVRITSTNGTDTFDAGTINILYE